MSAASARVEVRDPRTEEQHLRAAWHPERRTVVFSHWRHNVCVATTPVPVDELPAVLALLAQALGEAATGTQVPALETPDAAALAVPGWLTLGRDLVGLAHRSAEEGVRQLRRLLSWRP